MDPGEIHTAEAPVIRPWNRRDLVAVAALAVLWALCFWRYFALSPENRVSLPAGDFSDHFYVLRSFAYDELHAGRFPLWGGDGVFSVYPFQADPESVLFYPPAILNLLLWLTLGSKHLPLVAFQLESLGHVLLVSLLMYAFLRTEVRSRWAAVFGSVAFSYGGYVLSYPVQQISFLEAATWLPLALLGVKMLDGTGRNRYLVLTAVAITLAFLAGNPQNLTFLGYTTMAYYIYLSWRHRTRWQKVVTNLLLIGLLTVALSAVQLLPSMEWWRHSTRASISYEQAAVGFPPEDMVQLLLTGLVSWWQPLYVGLLTLVLALLAVISGRQRNTPFWVGLGIVALVFSFGKNVFGYEVAFLTLPGFGLFRDQERHAYLVSFSLAVLAAYGADFLLSPLDESATRLVSSAARWLRKALPVAFLLLAAVIYLNRAGLEAVDARKFPANLTVLFLCLCLTTMLLHLKLYRPGLQPAMGALLLLVLVFDLFSINRARYYAPVYDPNAVSPFWQPVLSDPGFFRVQEDNFPLQSNVAGRRALRQAWGVAIRLADYDEFLKRVDAPVRWKLTGVKYVVTSAWGHPIAKRPDSIPGEIVSQEGEGETLKQLYRLPEEPRPAWTVHQTVLAENRNQLQDLLNAPGFDPFSTAVLLDAAAVELGDPSADVVTLTHFEPNRVKLDARLSTGGLLVLGEVAYPGWQVYVDGKRATLQTADGVLRAVALPAGKWDVEFRFRPGTFYAGAAISSLTILVVVAVAVGSRLRRSLGSGSQA
jgi:hypothetical protein